MDCSSLTNSLSAAVQRYRQEKNQSAEECAHTLGVSKTALLNIEQKKANPTLETVEIIARNMGMDPLILLGQKETPDTVSSLLVMAMQTNTNPHRTLNTLPLAVHHMQTALNLMIALSKELGTDLTLSTHDLLL